MLPPILSDAKPDDILDLIEVEAEESLTIEFKRELPGPGADERREFLYDVAAMANAAGGDIVYGVIDRRDQSNQSTGIADSLAGLKIDNEQTTASRLSNLIRDSIAPRLLDVETKCIKCPDGWALVVRIPSSWNAPHMVTFQGANKFYKRAGTDKHLMSVDEIRRAFSGQRELGEAIANWRKHRVELVLRNEGPVPLQGSVTLLYHFIPASAFAQAVIKESWKVAEQEKPKLHLPVKEAGHSWRYNADGFLAFASISGTPACYGYTQVFRSGAVEYANNNCFQPFSISGTAEEFIFGQSLEEEIIRCFADTRRRLRESGADTPAYIGISLLGIAEKRFFRAFLI